MADKELKVARIFCSNFSHYTYVNSHRSCSRRTEPQQSSINEQDNIKLLCVLEKREFIAVNLTKHFPHDVTIIMGNKAGKYKHSKKINEN